MIHSPAPNLARAEQAILQQTAAPRPVAVKVCPANDAACVEVPKAARCPDCDPAPRENCMSRWPFPTSRDPNPLHDFETCDGPLFRLMREIADEACHVDIECHARFIGDGANGPVYDTTQLEPGHVDDPEMIASDQAAIERAVRYLDLRGLLHRPVAGYPNLVAFGGARG